MDMLTEPFLFFARVDPHFRFFTGFSPLPSPKNEFRSGYFHVYFYHKRLSKARMSLNLLMKTTFQSFSLTRHMHSLIYLLIKTKRTVINTHFTKNVSKILNGTNVITIIQLTCLSR